MGGVIAGVTKKRAVRSNVLFGLKTGLVLATVFSAWVTIVRVAAGPGAFERFGLTWGQIVGLYYGGLSLGGCACGAVEPLRRYAWGAMLQGFLLVLPLYVGIMTAMGLSLARVPSVHRDLLLGVIAATVVGGLAGLWMWMEEREARENSPDEASSRPP